MIDPAHFLAAYDELRGSVSALPEGMHAERDGPLVRTTGSSRGGMVEYGDLGGLEGAELDDLIARQVRIFAELGERFEWKLHGHDRPADLADRLRAAGFVPEAQETVLAAVASTIAAEPVLPAGVVLREATEQADFERIAAMLARAFGDPDADWLPPLLAQRRAFDPLSIGIYVAEAGGEPISAAWVRFHGDAAFATLHGGATVPEWRGRGVYRALVATRARLAAERGCRYLQVDASDDSRPILERLGFVALTTTTPFIWSPPG
ncbi:MAG TPA: GNAT family N-acetyltransferase [Gaiellales bacterium]|jgi:GNAT superfamily N-acetyltransferase|nr:GNAT family N-acetyltransferase [Gaiellales bacterium]